MMKMTPREALYYICLALGPQPKTLRNDNITYDEARLRDAIRTLQNFVDYHDDTNLKIPESANEYIHKDDYVAKPQGKDRIEKWKRELKAVSPRSGETSSHLQFGPDGNDA